MSCSADVRIYLNGAADSRIYDNKLIATNGIEILFVASTDDLRNNLVSGAIRNRDGGASAGSDNLTGVTLAQYQQWFVDPLAPDLNLPDGTAVADRAEPLAQVSDDHCARTHPATGPDGGAIEYAGPICDTTLPRGGVDLVHDAFETGGTGT